MSNFKSDLIFSKIYEKESLKYLEYDSYKFAPDIIFYKYDLKTIKDNIKTKYEIKADRMTYKTNNICIELNCLYKSKSDYYLYYIIKPNNFYDLYKIPINFIYEIIKNKNVIRGGDNSKSELILLNKNLFKDYLLITNKTIADTTT